MQTYTPTDPAGDPGRQWIETYPEGIMRDYATATLAAKRNAKRPPAIPAKLGKAAGYMIQYSLGQMKDDAMKGKRMIRPYEVTQKDFLNRPDFMATLKAISAGAPCKGTRVSVRH